MSTEYTDQTTHSSGLPAIDVHRSILVLEAVQSHIGIDPVPLTNPSGYVLGASADCDLVIQAQGIQPRHCEIYFDQGALCVRAWDDKSWLNDMPLLDARLQDGDRLSLGPVEFLVRQATSDELLIDQLKRDQDVKSVFRSRQADSAPNTGHASDFEFDEQYRTLLRFLNKRQCSMTDLLQTVDQLHSAEARIVHAQRKEDLIKELTSELQEVATELREQEHLLRSDQRANETVQRDGLAQDLEQLNLLRTQLVDERQDWEVNRQSTLDAFDVRESQLADHERALAQRMQKWEAETRETERQLDTRRSENQGSQIQHVNELDKRARVLHEREQVHQEWEAELEGRECELMAGWQVVREQQALLLEAMPNLSDPEAVAAELDDLRVYLVSERWQLQQARHAFLKRCAALGVDLKRFLPHVEHPQDAGTPRPADWDAVDWTEATTRDLLAGLRVTVAGQQATRTKRADARRRSSKRAMSMSMSMFGLRQTDPQALGLRYLLCANAIGLGALLFMQARFANAFTWGVPLQLEAMGWASIAIGGLGLVEVFLQRGLSRIRNARSLWPRWSRRPKGPVSGDGLEMDVRGLNDESSSRDWVPAASNAESTVDPQQVAATSVDA